MIEMLIMVSTYDTMIFIYLRVIPTMNEHVLQRNLSRLILEATRGKFLG